MQWLGEAIGDSAAILGVIPLWQKIALPERHLGLKFPSEHRNAASLELVADHFLDPGELLRLREFDEDDEELLLSERLDNTLAMSSALACSR